MPVNSMKLLVLCLVLAVTPALSLSPCGDLDQLPSVTDTQERCCRCVAQESQCNNDEADTDNKFRGFECNEIDAALYSAACNLSPPAGSEEEFPVIDSNLFSLRATEMGTKCPDGEKLCCNPLPSGVLARELDGRKQLDFSSEVCLRPAVAAVQNFSLGITCGRRDSRVYFDHGVVPKGFTNPGEWPWVVPIYHVDNGTEKYIGAGAYVDSKVVITVAHNLKPFEDRPHLLRVRLGDWNPNIRWSRDYQEGNLEEYPEIEVRKG